MSIRIASTPADPAYVQVAAMLRAAIRDGRYERGVALPSERDLASEIGISRATLRRSIGLLEREGLIERDSTRGTFVAEPRIPLRIGSFSDEVFRSGHLPSAEVTWASLVQPDDEVAQNLGVEGSDSAIAIQRLRRSDGIAIALETSYYAASQVPGLLDGDLSGSLWGEIGRRFGIVMRTTAAELQVSNLDTSDALSLGALPGTAAFRIVRRTFDSNDACVEFARDVYRADRVALLVERDLPT